MNFKKGLPVNPRGSITSQFFRSVGVLVVNFVLPLEFVTPSWRTFCGCVGFWAVGLMTLAVWGYFITSWRYLIIGTSVSGIFMLFSWW